MEFVHTEIEQNTKVTLQLELNERDIEILMLIFAADLRLPRILEADGDLRCSDITKGDIEDFMAEVNGQLMDLYNCI